MYPIDAVTQKENVIQHATERAPFGPGFSSEVAAKADRLEIWGSSFEDAGPDFTEFRLMAGDVVIEKRRVLGY